MSAYALPGLFPPVDTISQSCSSRVESIDDSFDTLQESPSSVKNLPLHLDEQDTNHCNRCDNRSYGKTGEGYEMTCSSSKNIGCILNSAAIAVKEAKIDPVRWIQYVTRSKPQQYARQIGKTLRRRVFVGNNNNASGSRSHRQSSRIRGDLTSGLNHNSDYSSGDSCCSNTDKSQQNEAIEFELSITFNGRKYTAKRTMQCIMQLRDDLIREMKRRRHWLLERKDTSMPRHLESPHGSSKTNKADGHHSFSQHSYFETAKNNNVTSKQAQNSKNSYAVQIPEIPPLTSGHDRRHMHGDSGFVGKGFTMLHAMVKSYVPKMEKWFKNVVEIVPQDSECLMNFLWEPSTESTSTCFKSVVDSINNNDHSVVSKKLKSSTSLATLDSIKEMDYDTEDDDSDSEEYLDGGWKE